MVRARAAMRGRIPITTLPCFCMIWTDRARELNQLADIGTEILEATGEAVTPCPIAAGAYRERTPLMREIRREGIDL